MKKIINKNGYDELITKMRECVEWYQKRNFDEQIYNLTLDNGERLKICFAHSTIAHLLGINTEYLKSTGQFPKDSYEILKLVCNDSYRLYNMVTHGHLTYDSFISDYAYEKLEGFQNICGIDLYNIEFVCKYSKECSYVTGNKSLESDYFIGYSAMNGLYIIGIKKNENYYYPMTNRYIDYNDEESMKFLEEMFENQTITMPAMSNIYYRKNGTYSTTKTISDQRKLTKIKEIMSYAKNYNAKIEVANGYLYAIEKLLRQYESKNTLYPMLKTIFEKISKRITIDITDIELEHGQLPEEVLTLIDSYNESLEVDISAALDEHTRKVEEENSHLKNEQEKHLKELRMLKEELLKAQAQIQNLQTENESYRQKEEETISAMKRIYHL